MGVWIIGGIIVFQLYTFSDLQMAFNVIIDLILKLDLDVEVASVETKESVYCLTITFE